MKQPIVSVIMSVYNAERYLDDAIQSILTQTYQNFEFIIINDGSTDKSLEIIKKYKNKDERIILISRENKGLIYSLNEGISISKGKYIARMDADDISLPTRFEKQINLMKKEDLDLCGCNIFIINEFNQYISALVVSDKRSFNGIILTRKVPFAHGSVMIKKEFLIANSLQYGNTKYYRVEDYALWVQSQESGGEISNVNDFLFKYRDIDCSLSKNKLNYKHAKKVSNEYIAKNYIKLNSIFNEYKDRINEMNEFEKDQLSFFLIKTIFRGETFKKIKYLKKIPLSINIINFLRIVTPV